MQRTSILGSPVITLGPDCKEVGCFEHPTITSSIHAQNTSEKDQFLNRSSIIIRYSLKQFILLIQSLRTQCSPKLFRSLSGAIASQNKTPIDSLIVNVRFSVK